MALVSALAQLNQLGITTIIITHNPNFINNVSKLLVMQNGSVAAFGPKDWVMSQIHQLKGQQSQVTA